MKLLFIKIKRNNDHLLIDLLSVLLNERYTSKIAINPSAAAKSLWTCSGIALLISYGNIGNLLSAKAISTSSFGQKTKP